MEKTTLYLPAELQAELRAAAAREKRPQADLVRDALTEYLSARPVPAPRSIGALASGTVRARDAKRVVRNSFEQQDRIRRSRKKT